MFNEPINEFILKCNDLSPEMSVRYSNVAPTFVFSNTGRRGSTKYFSITLSQIIEVFQDMIRNFSVFSAHAYYVEADWRDLFGENITNEVVNALSTVQTLPLFELVNKIIVIANGLDAEYEYKKMPLTLNYLENALLYLRNQLPDNDLYLETLRGDTRNIKHFSVTEEVINDFYQTRSITIKGRNQIFYGAPGTGKSHTIDELTAGKKKVVTVFHPDTQHADFVGSLKPTAIGNAVTYQFRPGPFVNALIIATNFPDEHVYLVIEEINRAPAAAVFGELFQLLDRKDGSSKYPIDAADPDLLAYITEKTSGLLSKLSIPKNLSILATMNSSDQAVMPLDTAFKRRWSFRYIRIDFENSDISNQYFKILTTSGLYKITWRNFADKVINQLLKELRIPEDRLLGPFFLSNAELADESTAAESLCGKLFVYLWDDVLRHKGRGFVFNEEIGTFGELHDHFSHQDKPVFSDKAESLIIQFGTSMATDNTESEISAEDV